MPRYDAIVIGAGHNGLVAAARLAMRGLRVAVLERNGFVGGMASSPDLWPGFKVPIGAYVLSLFRREIAEELGLFERGLRLIPKEPGMSVFLERGRIISVWSDVEKTSKEIARFSERDAQKYREWSRFWSFVGSILDVLYTTRPLDLYDTLELVRRLMGMAKTGRERAFRYLNDLPWVLAAPASKVLEEYFESEEVRAALVEDSVVGEMISPSSPGSSIVMAHHYVGNITGSRGQWAYVEGGMGRLSEILAERCRELGVEIHLGVEVERIVVRGEWARGVMARGKMYEGWMILSTADVRTTMLKLLDPEAGLDTDLVRRLKSLKSVGASSKIVVAARDLPRLSGKLSGHEGLVYRSSAITIPSVDYVEKAYRDALLSGMSEEPWISVNVQSYLDRTVAPEGWHVFSLFTQYTSRKSPGGWGEEDKEKLLEKTFNVLENYYEGFRRRAENILTITPKDLEELFQTPGGNIFHISMIPDQLWSNRPDRELSNYRTPVRGLYLCGSSTHPGGGVSGVSGYLCSEEALIDAGLKKRSKLYKAFVKALRGVLGT